MEVLPEGTIIGIPGHKSVDLKSRHLKQTNTFHKCEPHKPEWFDHVYHPKTTISPPWTVRPASRKGEVFYGVFGSDDRQVYYPSGYPWQCIGRIFSWNDAMNDSPAWSGSGVLLGPRVVLTAGHVVPWDAKTWKMLFVPAYYDGGSIIGSGTSSWTSDCHGWSVSYYSRIPNAFDMAVLRLYEPLGDSLGYFGAKVYSNKWSDIRYFNLTGYPGAVASGERPSYQPGIPVIDADADGDAVVLEHEGDATPGDSGAPFWATWSDGFPYAIGTISGGEKTSEEDDNIAAGGKAMIDLINWARSNWP